MSSPSHCIFFFFFNDTATTEIYTLSLHDALPISVGTTLDEAEKILAQHRIEKLPVVDERGVLKGLITIKDIFKRRQHPDANKDQHERLRVAAAVGGTPDAKARAAALLQPACDAIANALPHGHA